MRQYIIRRLLVSLVVLLGITMILYGLIRAMPADYIDSITQSM